MSAHGRHPLTLPELESWVLNGATWRAREISDEHAVVELRTCFGELVDVREGGAADLIEYIRARRED